MEEVREELVVTSILRVGIDIWVRGLDGGEGGKFAGNDVLWRLMGVCAPDEPFINFTMAQITKATEPKVSTTCQYFISIPIIITTIMRPPPDVFILAM